MSKMHPTFGFQRSQNPEYGTHLWLWRVRIGSRKTMNPDYNGPRITKGGDEYCNDVLCMHLYPFVAIDIWYKPRLRKVKDGMCEACKNELRQDGWTDDQIRREEISRMLDTIQIEKVAEIERRNNRKGKAA